MLFTPWLHTLKFPSRRTRADRRRRAARNRRAASIGAIEALEDRTLLSVSFAPFEILSTETQADPVVGDFNNDGLLDVAAAYNGSAFPNNLSIFAVFLGTGAGNFDPPTLFNPGTGGCFTGGGAIETADFNNDGNLDLVMTHGGSAGGCFGNKVTVHLGDGAGGFTAPVTPFTSGGSIGILTVGDFDEDGNLDLAIPASDQRVVFIHRGLGNGSFTTLPSLPVGETSSAILNRDLDSDGHLDLAVTSQNRLNVYFGTGTGSFSAPLQLSVPNAVVAQAGDFNEDGILDLAATSNSGGTVSIFLGTGGGTFAAPAIFAAGTRPASLVTADFDGDGHQDLAVGSSTTATLSVLPGDGAGGFGTPVGFTAGANPGSRVLAADFNGDGLPDLAATSGDPPGVSILLNLPELIVQIDIKPGSDPNSINLGSKGTIPVAIFSTSTFDATTIDPTTVTLADAAVKVRGKGTPMASEEDVNGDGRLDLVVHVETEGLELTDADSQAQLTGETFDGVSIIGSDTVRVVAALHVAGGPAEGLFVGDGLTHATLNSVVEQSLAYWTAVGVESHRLDDLTRVDVQIADLSDSLLGIAALNRVWIDRDAAGYGWSVNSGGVDLFSAVTHEFGHVLGFEHSDDGMMAETLPVGERHLPGEEHNHESETLLIPVFDTNTQDESSSDDSLGTGVIASPQPLAEKSSYAVETNIGTSLTDVDFDYSEAVPYLPEEDLDADSFFSEFENSLLDDLLAIS